MNYEEYYSDKQRCFADIHVARKGWGRSLESDEQIRKTLGIMLIYCPEEITHVVRATLDELDRRIELLFASGKYEEAS